jgi:hypothetical protein
MRNEGSAHRRTAYPPQCGAIGCAVCGRPQWDDNRPASRVDHLLHGVARAHGRNQHTPGGVALSHSIRGSTNRARTQAAYRKPGRPGADRNLYDVKDLLYGSNDAAYLLRRLARERPAVAGSLIHRPAPEIIDTPRSP